MSTEAKCPVHHAASGQSNRDWWPNQLKLELLHQHSSKSNPMGEDFDYAKEFKSLDLAAMKKADDGIPQTVAPIEEVQLYVSNAGGNRTYVTFRELVEATNGATATRADLHISRSRDGELFMTSRQDGMIRMLVPDSSGSATRAARQ